MPQNELSFQIDTPVGELVINQFEPMRLNDKHPVTVVDVSLKSSKYISSE
jgi:hypothetical protein